jgi:predicted GNAT family N-acyltransferase
MSLELSIVNYESKLYPEILTLRNEVLRKPIGLNLFEEDISEDKDQYIIAAVDQEQVVACLMLKIIDKNTVKFRQMAVDSNYQYQGIGALLVRYAENFCILNEYFKIELHARISAQPFYEKLEYNIIGTEFEEVGIPHIKMVKEFNMHLEHA